MQLSRFITFSRYGIPVLSELFPDQRPAKTWLSKQSSDYDNGSEDEPVDSKNAKAFFSQMFKQEPDAEDPHNC